MEKDRLSHLVAQNLLQINAIKINAQNPFTWASGIISPIYCDNRLTLSDIRVRKIIKNGLASLAEDFGDFDVVAGVATAGIPHGALLADLLEKPFVYVRDKAKGHGKQNQIEGRLDPQQRVLMVEDLISTGGSSLKAVGAIRSNGNEVAGVLAIFTYGFPAAEENFKKAQCPFKTLSSYDVLLQEALKLNLIETENLKELKRWNADPQNWFSSKNL
jgi:orotate phosphoribosyltransferase